MKVVYLIICGARPAMHAVKFVEAAHTADWDCHVIATPTGATFADLDALEATSGHPVTTEHRKPGTPRRDRPDADALVIAPATANTICKLAAGITDTYALDVASEHIGLGTPTLVVPFANSALTRRAPYLKATAALTEEGVTFLKLPKHRPHQGNQIVEWFPWRPSFTHAAELAERCRSRPEPAASCGSGSAAAPPPSSNTPDSPECR